MHVVVLNEDSLGDNPVIQLEIRISPSIRDISEYGRKDENTYVFDKHKRYALSAAYVYLHKAMLSVCCALLFVHNVPVV